MGIDTYSFRSPAQLVYYFPLDYSQQHRSETVDIGRRSGDERRSVEDNRHPDNWVSRSDGRYSSQGPPSRLDRGDSGDIRRSGGRFDGLGSGQGTRGSGISAGGNRTIPPSGVSVKRTGGGIQVGEHTGFLRMRGLPFSAAKEDIYDFFGDYNPILDSIVLTYRSDGRATGEAYVEFSSPDDSKRAMELHRKSMGSRYIELFLSNREEHGRAISRFGDR